MASVLQIHLRSKRSLALILALVIVMQGCRVYHPQNSTLDSAMTNRSQVKVILKDNDPYYFDYLSKQGDTYLGTTDRNTATAEFLEMDGFAFTINGDDHIFELPPEDIMFIYEKNKTTSTLMTILVSVSAA